MVINSPCLTDKKELVIPGQTATGKEFSNPLMAGSLLKTITYLEKSDENVEFHQIVDFLSTCSIKYALTAVVISESSVRSDLLFNDEDGVTCLTNDEIFENLALMGYEQLSTKHTFQKGRGDSVERAITTDASLDAAHDSDNIFKTQSTAMLNVDFPQGIDTCGIPRRQETMRGTPAQTRSKRVLEQPNEPPLLEDHTSGSGEGRMEQTFELTDNLPSTPHDSPLIGGYTPGSDEGRMKLDELITLCTKLLKQVIDLEKEKDAQAVEILNLKKRVKKLERKRKSSISHPRMRKYKKVETSSDDGLDEEDASKQGRRSDMIKPMFTNKDFEELLKGLQRLEVNHLLGLKIHGLYERQQKRNQDFIPMDTEVINDSGKKNDSSSKPAEGSRKKTLARKRSAKSEEEAAADYEHEKEELRMWLTVVSDEEDTMDPKILSAKYPIVDWESQNLGSVDMEDLYVYKIIRADGNTSYHKSLSSMLRKFDRYDLVDLHRLVMKRFEDTTLEGYNMLLWGNLKVIFESNAEDEIWSN
ncbi:hypothetical protein Tco_0060147 [Tanacetum coccineum]